MAGKINKIMSVSVLLIITTFMVFPNVMSIEPKIIPQTNALISNTIMKNGKSPTDEQGYSINPIKHGVEKNVYRNVILYEDFEGPWISDAEGDPIPSPGWQNERYDTTPNDDYPWLMGYWWNCTDANYVGFGNTSAFCWWDYQLQQERLIAPPINLTQWENISVTFWVFALGEWYQGTYHITNEYSLEISTDGGNTWIEIVNITNATADSNEWAYPLTYNLDAYCDENATQLLISWYYYHPESWSDYIACVGLDNVTITGEEVVYNVDYILITDENGTEIQNQNISEGIIKCYASAFNYTHGFIGFIDVNWSIVNYNSNASINTTYGKSVEFYAGEKAGFSILYASDGIHNDSVKFSVCGIFTFSLSQGWNMIGLPVEGDYNASTLFSIIPYCNILLRWNTTLKNFDLYVPGAPFVFDIEVGLGYLVAVTSNSTFSVYGCPVESVSIPLGVGWNMLGWFNHYKEYTYASSILSNITNCTIVLKWNTTLHNFDLYVPGAPSDFKIHKGEGFLIAVNEASIWHGEG